MTWTREKVVAEVLGWQVWKPDPTDRFGHQTVNEAHCRARIFNMFRAHQCFFKAKVELEGVKFCKTHFNSITREIERKVKWRCSSGS